MINNFISLVVSEYAIIVYEMVVIITLFLFVRNKRKEVKRLEQEVAMSSKKQQQDALDNMLRNSRKGARE